MIVFVIFGKALLEGNLNNDKCKVCEIPASKYIQSSSCILLRLLVVQATRDYIVEYYTY